ncbi:MAG: ParB/RepB/Spo0J family partition protein [Candidatus Spechtbacteria bacterium]|nr:ParB/RepB/Spo0J family partition protein [Candidatus Spechtbacteria bacterium]
MKGLESLIPRRKPNERSEGETKESVFLIDVDQITPNPYQPRREFEAGALRDLSDSIKVYGILQPLIVSKLERDVPGGREVKYELIAGERRLRAAKMARLPRVPAIVRHSTDKQKLEVSLIENIQRDDLNAVEEAEAFKKLQEEFGMKQGEIAKRVSKSVPYVANTIRILSLPQNVTDALKKGDISEGHTRPLLSLEPGAQGKLFEEILANKYTVRQAEERARELKPEDKFKKTNGAKKVKDEELAELLQRFKETFEVLDAKARTTEKRANLAVHFSSKNDLRRWIENLLN